MSNRRSTAAVPSGETFRRRSSSDVVANPSIVLRCSNKASRHLALWAALFVAAIPRLLSLDAEPISGDEAFSWRLATMPVRPMLIAASLDTHPPLHFVVEHAWIAMFGDSLAVLRALSVLAGIMLVPAVYAAVSEATGFHTCGGVATRRGAVAAAVLVALHPGEIVQSRVARMYSLGMLLAAVASWLLLRAMRNSDSSAWYWRAYGILAGLFLLCHHFAWFTVAAHFVFIVSEVAPPRGRSRNARAAFLAGVAEAVGLAVICCCWWLPATVTQVLRVRTDFWIPPVDWGDSARAIVEWAVGWGVNAGAYSLAIGIAALVIWGISSAGRAGQLFALMAVVPGIAAALVSTVGGRPLIQERYFSFAHVGLLCLCGVAIGKAMASRPSAFMAATIGAAWLAGVGSHAKLPCDTAGGLEAVAADLVVSAAPGDLIAVPRARTLLRLRYYVDRLGGGAIPIMAPCDVSIIGGHVNHIAALSPNEFIASHDAREIIAAQRIWSVSDVGGRAEIGGKRWRLTGTRTFPCAGADESISCFVELLVPRDEALPALTK